MQPISLQPTILPPDYYENGVYRAMNVTWALTRKCSLACSYCTVCDRYSSYEPTEEVMQNTLRYIVEVVNTRKYAEIMLFGGEPTLHPQWMNILKHLRTHCKKTTTLNIFTNLHASADDYARAQGEFDLGIETSYHYGVDAFSYIDKVLKLSPRALQCYVMFDPRDIEGCKRVFYTLLDNGYYAELNRIHDKDLVLTKEQEAYMLAESLFNEKAIKRYLRYGYDNGGFKEFSFQQASMLGLDRFQGWQCSAGAANVFIECNGDVYPCQVYANEGLLPVGNTNSLDASLQLPEETCKCIDCSCEIFLPKRLTK